MTLRACVRAFVAISCVGELTACSGAAAAAKHARRGDAYVAAQRYDAAIIEYRNAIKRQPSWAEASRKLGDAYLATGENTLAFDAYEHATALDPADLEARFAAVRVLLGSGDFDAAKVRAEAIVDRDPENSEARALIEQADGQAAARRGDAKEAGERFRAAVAIAPSSVDAHVAFSRFLADGRRFDEAAREARAALAADPASELANRSMAWLLMAMKRPGEAEPYLRAAAARNPQRYSSTLALADYEISQHRYEQARQALERFRPVTVAVRLRLASIAYDTGATADAHTMLDAVLKKGNSAEALVLQAKFLMAEHKRPEALQAARAALQMNGTLAAAHYVVGALAFEDNRFEDAEQSLRDALRFDPDNPGTLVMLARVELALGKADKALGYAEASGRDPQSRVVADRARLALGDVQRARADLTELAEASTPARDAVLTLALLDADAGRAADARARLEAVRQASPDDSHVLVASALVAKADGDRPAAEQFLQRAIAVSPASFDPVAMLGDLYIDAGRLDAAGTLFEDFSRRVPTSAAGPTALGMVLEAQHRAAAAREAYERAVEIDPKSQVAIENLARVRSAGAPAR